MKTKISALRTVNMFIIAASAVLFAFSAGDAAAAFCGERECSKAPPPPPPPPPPTGSCLGSSSLAALVTGTNVVAYVPLGAWDGGATGVAALNIEGTSITNTLIATPNIANSCASNPITGQTVCVANNTDVYVLTGTTLSKTLTSGGSGTTSFSGGACTNCSVMMDGVHNKAAIGLAIDDVAGFQFLDLATSTFEPAFTSKSPDREISENPLIDPSRNFVLSASEGNNYEIVNVATSTKPTFFEKAITNSGVEADSSSEDCQTGIALAPYEFTSTSQVFIADLTQAKFTAGTPSGTWTAPSQIQTLTESVGLGAGSCGSAVAQGTHIGIITGEFGGDLITAIQLPATSGSGTPAITDWVTCAIGSGYSQGNDPHTVTAYQDPVSPKDAIALVAGPGPTATTVVRVDLTKMLNKTIVPRTAAGHGCTAGTLPATVTTFFTVP
jgi:hypothetical protein